MNSCLHVCTDTSENNVAGYENVTSLLKLNNCSKYLRAQIRSAPTARFQLGQNEIPLIIHKHVLVIIFREIRARLMKEKCAAEERQRFLRFGRYFAGLIQTMAHPSAAKCESNKTKAFERSDYRSSASASVSLQLSKLPIYRGEALSTCETKLVIAPYISLKSTYITS